MYLIGKSIVITPSVAIQFEPVVYYKFIVRSVSPVLVFVVTPEVHCLVVSVEVV